MYFYLNCTLSIQISKTKLLVKMASERGRFANLMEDLQEIIDNKDSKQTKAVIEKSQAQIQGEARRAQPPSSAKINKAVLEPSVLPAFAITFFCNHCNIRFENTSKYVDTLTFFSKNLNQRSLTPR